MCSTCFGHKYIHHQELGTIMLNYHIGRIVLGSMCVGVSVWLGWSGIRVSGWSTTPSACKMDTTPIQPPWNSNTHRTKNNTTNVVIQQNSRKLLMMDILMSETCWAHKKWNKIESDFKLVFYSSTKIIQFWRTTQYNDAVWYPHLTCWISHLFQVASMTLDTFP